MEVGLVRHVRTDAGEHFYHLPIGSPISGTALSGDLRPAALANQAKNGRVSVDAGKAHVAA